MNAQAINGSRRTLREAQRTLARAASWQRLAQALPAGLPGLRGQCGALAKVCKRWALLRAMG